MQFDSGMIAVPIVVVGLFFVIVAIFATVEQRRTASAYKKALADSKAENREWRELQRETNRLLTLIAEKLDRTQK